MAQSPCSVMSGCYRVSSRRGLTSTEEIRRRKEEVVLEPRSETQVGSRVVVRSACDVPEGQGRCVRWALQPRGRFYSVRPVRVNSK